jgi:phage shock protein C
MRRDGYPSGNRLYRSTDGKIGGVCGGLANFLNVKVGFVRFFAIVITFITGIWPGVAIYFAACLFIKPEPVIPLENEYQRDFYDGYVSSRSRALRDLKRRFSNLDRRLRRMEDRVTSRDFEWEERLNS